MINKKSFVSLVTIVVIFYLHVHRNDYYSAFTYVLLQLQLQAC